MFFLIIVIFAIGFLIIGYDQFNDYKNKKEQLQYPSETQPWQWLDEYYRIQIHTEDGKSVLRKVDLENKKAVYASLNQDYSLRAVVIFDQKCKPKSIITTSKKFSDGTPKALACTDSGKSLAYSVRYSIKEDGNYDFRWHEDLDGFKVYTNFANWDFTLLRKEITLQKAAITAP